jgi:hypothetical protein
LALRQDAIRLLGEFANDLAQIRHRIAPGLGVHQLVEGDQESRLFVLGLDVPTTERTLTLRWLDALAHFAFGLDHCVAAHARALGYRRLATSPERLGHRAGDDPAL